MKRVRVLPVARSAAFLGAFAGLAAGIIYSFGGAIIDVLVEFGWITTSETPGVAYGTALAFLALIGMPIIFSTIGAIAASVAAIMYNSVARWIGTWAHRVVSEEVFDFEP